ncbi:MAG TPA: response regulator [Desulfonatronum sp.]|nr:response regulator [Desulfonatronum sp.]
MNKDMRILLVDDSSTMRSIIKNILKQLGFRNVHDADDGSTAWEKVQKESFDLIISDWNMPKMKGIDLLKQVRSHPGLKDMPFLMVTAEGLQENIVEAAKAQVSNYIVKPFTPEVLLQKLNAIFAKK